MASQYAAPTWPPSARLIDAVIRFADQRKPCGPGRSILSLSTSRRNQADVIQATGHEWRRIGAVQVVWDELDEQMVRIIDDSLLEPSAAEWWEDYFDRFEADDALPLAA